MLINLRDKKNNLVVKDILDIDFDMSVEEENGKFYIGVNRSYRIDEEFLIKSAAEERMLTVADIRNNLEEELRNY